MLVAMGYQGHAVMSAPLPPAAPLRRDEEEEAEVFWEWEVR